MRRTAPSQEYQGISPTPTEFEMQRGIRSPPAGITFDRDIHMSPPSLFPGASTRAGSRFNYYPLDPSSPNLNDNLGSRGRPLSQVDLLGADRDRAYDSDAGLGIHQPTLVAQRRKDKGLLSKVIKNKWWMVVCLFLGVAGALSHHFLYLHLHNREASNQQWWLRLGQFLSFISKASFVVAVLLAREQVAWRVVGQKSFTIHAVDSLFGAAHDAFGLFNKEAWKNSWFTMLLAIYIWASPLVVIFTSATLDVVLETKLENVTCPSVRTLNFANDAKKSWKDNKIAKNETLRGLSISMFNSMMDDITDPYAFDYWLKPASPLDSIASRVLAAGKAIQRDEVAQEICGEDWDCSTIIHFVGPGYKCEQLAKGANSTMSKFEDYETPFNLSQLAPAGNATYYTITDLGEYSPEQIEVNENNKPVQKPPFPKNAGAFRTEPVIWLGYVEVDDMEAAHASNRSNITKWEDDYTPVITACEHWETNYTIELNYTNGHQSYKVMGRDYMHKIIDTTYKNESASDGTLDPVVAVPETNYVFPQDWREYRRIAAFHSLGKKIRDLLQGSVQKLPEPITLSTISSSQLVVRPETLTIPDFEKAVRTLYEDLLISLLSDPLLLAVAWASHPDELSGRNEGGPDTKYPCIRRHTGNYFHYHWSILVFVYIASFTIATMAVVCGFRAMQRDGVDELREMTFSAIARTTKLMDLDKNEDRKRRIRAVEERPGSGVFEFKVEDYNQWGSSNTKGTKSRSSPLIRESPIP
ncbi:hypothetical protein FSARC_13598 [Fusarium sarcochroum]|uniref:Uncharacterized protein n=1 Tax=Fusarium sarcochroum TaxID=1208366 RepID=A0A8H4WT85_9HYPO|nr:hypothetical protein FSARC_13598 [Fusarium sarcochroum]